MPTCSAVFSFLISQFEPSTPPSHPPIMSQQEGKARLLPHKPDPALLESFRYINSMPGKNVRGKLIDCFQIWMKVESSNVLDSIKVCAICCPTRWTLLQILYFRTQESYDY